MREKQYRYMVVRGNGNNWTAHISGEEMRHNCQLDEVLNKYARLNYRVSRHSMTAPEDLLSLPFDTLILEREATDREYC